MGSLLKGFGLDSRKRHHHRPTMFDRNPGQAIVLVAVLMIVLLGFTGLAVDGGELYFLQKNMQNAADAAVLAGLYEICSDPSLDLDTMHGNLMLSAEAAINDNGFYDGVDGTTIVISHPATPPGAGGVNFNYMEVTITANKPARLIQVVYQGPLQVTVKAGGKCTPVTPWADGAAMFGIGTCFAPKESITRTGSSFTVEGGIFGNGDVNIGVSGGGSSGSVQGGITAGGTVDDHNKVNYSNPSAGQPSSNQPTRTPPQFWEQDHFKPDGPTALWAQDRHAYFYDDEGDATSWTDFDDSPNGDNATDPPTPGIYYAVGNIDLGTPNAELDAGKNLEEKTFVAAGTITINSNDSNLMSAYPVPSDEVLEAKYDVLPLLFTEYGNQDCAETSSNDAINFGSKFNFYGAIYAPNGMCTFSGSDSTGEGGIMCFTMALSGSNFTMIYEPDRFPPPPPSVGVTG